MSTFTEVLTGFLSSVPLKSCYLLFSFVGITKYKSAVPIYVTDICQHAHVTMRKIQRLKKAFMNLARSFTLFWHLHTTALNDW